MICSSQRHWVHLLLATLLLTLFTALSAEAQIKPKVIKSGKAATALVVLPSGRGFGSAFCIDAEGYFVTNEHVVRSTPDGKVQLVIRSGSKEEKTVEATVVRKDKESDIALVKTAAKLNFTALKLGQVDGLIETQQLVAFGYPFGTALNVKEQKFPNISVNVGRITALRMADDELQRIQLDAELNRGNSGGPVINDKGDVVGVVQAGVSGSGVNFAIPVSHVRQFLATPEVAFDPPDVSFAKRHEPTEHTVRVTSFLPGDREYDVQIVLESTRGRQRRVSLAQGEDGAHRGKLSVVEKPLGKSRMPIDIAFTQGLIRGEVEDAAFKVGKVAARLRDVRSIKRADDRWQVVARGGESATLDALKLKNMTVYVGGQPLEIGLDEVDAITIYQPPKPAETVGYTVEVRHDGELVASASGSIRILDVPAAPRTSGGELAKGPPEYRPPEEKVRFEGDHLVTRLPEAYARYVLGGTGRYMIFHLKEAKTVAVMDLLSGRIVHQIKDVSDDVLLAAGAEKLLLVLPSQKFIQRYSLKTFEREKIARLPGKGATRAAHMGCNGLGPLLLGAGDAILFDIEKMEPIDVDGTVVGASGYNNYMPQTRVSADGRIFTSIPTGYGAVPYARMMVDGRRTTVQKFGSTSYATRWAQPTANGYLMLMPGAGFVSANLEPLETKWLNGMFTITTVDPRFFLAPSFVDDKERGTNVAHVNFCTVNDRQIVHTYVGLEEVGITGNTNGRRGKYNQHLNSSEPLIHWIPWANLLVTLEFDRQKMHLRRFNLIQSMNDSGVDYLFVDSLPPSKAARGETLDYQIHAHSNSPGVKFNLASGPEGVRVSQAGKVTWRVPADYVEEWAQVVVTVTNSVGKERFHSFRLKVEDAAREIEAVSGK